MRVLHFCESFSPLSESFIYDIVCESASQGLDTQVLTYARLGESARPFKPVTVVSMPKRRSLRGLTYRVLGRVGLFNWQEHLRQRVVEAVQHLRPDLIHAHFGPAGFEVCEAVRRIGVPLVVSFMGKDISVLPWQTLWLRRYDEVFRQASILVGISDHCCERLAHLGAPKAKIRKLHLGIRLSEFSFSPPSSRYGQGPVKCLHVGRLVEKKSPLDLVRAFGHAASITNCSPSLSLTILGDGPLRRDLLKVISQEGLSDKVRWLGAQPRQRVREELAQAHLYTQHCRTGRDGDEEGQGVSLVEASATGLPVISTVHNGIPEVVLDNKTGFLVREGDYFGMGERIAQLASDPSRWDEMGRLGRAHVENNFNLPTQVALLQEVYREALAL